MLENVDEVVDWFQNERIERQLDYVELWENNEIDELESKLGEKYEQFQEMLEQIQEEKAKDEMKQQVLKEELISDGFDRSVALFIVDAINSSVDPNDDLIILKRKTSPDELRNLMDLSVKLYLGKINWEELISEIEKIDEGELDEDATIERGNEDEAISDMSSDLLSRANRFLQASVRVSLTDLGGIADVKRDVRESTNFNDEYAEALFDPIDENLSELQRYWTSNYVNNINDRVKDIENKIDTIMNMMSERSDM